MSNVSYYTAEGLKKLRDELKQLKDVERIKASRAIAEASTATAINSNKPVRAFVTSSDLRSDDTARRIKDSNTTI